MNIPQTARQDIVILPPQDNKKLRLGFNIFESEEQYQKYIKEKEGEEPLSKYLHKNHPDRQKETNLSDRYRVYHHESFINPSVRGNRVIEILQNLKGTPYNNETINELVSFRPSAVRVANNGVTCDGCPWRITIYLEEDNVTIRKIEQEVEVGKYGHGIFQDVSENEPSCGV